MITVNDTYSPKLSLPERPEDDSAILAKAIVLANKANWQRASRGQKPFDLKNSTDPVGDLIRILAESRVPDSENIIKKLSSLPAERKGLLEKVLTRGRDSDIVIRDNEFRLGDKRESQV